MKLIFNIVQNNKQYSILTQKVRGTFVTINMNKITVILVRPYKIYWCEQKHSFLNI